MGRLVACDVLILKLSDAAGPDGTWSYQDILPCQTQEEITYEQVVQVLGDVGIDMDDCVKWESEVIDVLEQALGKER